MPTASKQWIWNFVSVSRLRFGGHARLSAQHSSSSWRRNQTVGEPKRLDASMLAGKFLALQVAAAGLLMLTSYHAGFAR